MGLVEDADTHTKLHADAKMAGASQSQGAKAEWEHTGALRCAIGS